MESTPGLWGSGWADGAQGPTTACLWVPCTYNLINVFCQNPSDLFCYLCIPAAKRWMMLLEIIKKQLYSYPKGICYNLIIFSSFYLFIYFPFTWTLMTSLWAAVFFYCHFIWSPVVSEWFSANQFWWLTWVCTQVGLLLSSLGRVGLCTPKGRLCHKKEPHGKTHANQPQSHCSPHLTSTV